MGRHRLCVERLVQDIQAVVGKAGFQKLHNWGKPKQWDALADSRCPGRNIGMKLAAHLHMCNKTWRTQLIYNYVLEVEQWMEINKLHPQLMEWILKYIKNQGRMKFGDFSRLPKQMRNKV